METPVSTSTSKIIINVTFEKFLLSVFFTYSVFINHYISPASVVT